VAEKKIAVPSEDKKETLSNLQNLVSSIMDKPKERPTYIPPQLTRPDVWEEPTIS